jgi:LysR family transcriptional activator of glutamate synthase operon
MDLLQLKYFLNVAQTEHLTRAAKQLNVSQPALSIAVSRLEKELGRPLFDRVGRNIRLNECGRLYYQYVSQAMRLLDSGKAAVEDLCSDAGKTVTIAATGSRVLHGAFHEYLAQKKDVRLQMVRIRTTEVDDYLERSDVDYILSSVPVIGENYQQLLLMKEDLVLVVNEHNPLASRRKIALSEARYERFIALPQGYGLRDNSDELFRRAGIAPNIVMECDNDMRITMIAANYGVTLTSRNACTSGVFPSSAVFLDIISPLYKREVCLAWNKRRYLPQAAVAFREFLYAYCRSKFHQPDEDE